MLTGAGAWKFSAAMVAGFAWWVKGDLCIAQTIAVTIAAIEEFDCAKSSKQLGFKAIRVRA
jgi:hypothetical protein